MSTNSSCPILSGSITDKSSLYFGLLVPSWLFSPGSFQSTCMLLDSSSLMFQLFSSVWELGFEYILTFTTIPNGVPSKKDILSEVTKYLTLGSIFLALLILQHIGGVVTKLNEIKSNPVHRKFGFVVANLGRAIAVFGWVLVK
jgi:hypothetical protein